MALIRWLGSLTFTVIICVLLMALLIISTTMESKLGTDAIQKMFYQTRWFDFVLSLFWINIFCSTVLRFPFQRGHVGFIITHIGILILLIGAMMARIMGVEGRMTLDEGETSKSIVTGGYHLSVKAPSGEKAVIPLGRGGQNVLLNSSDVKIRIGQVIEHSVEEESVSDGGADHLTNHAVHFKLTSEMMGMKKDFWLIENSPVNSDANTIVMGPAHFLLKAGTLEASKVENPTLTIKDNSGAVIVSMAVDVPPIAPVQLGSTGLHIENLFYYSHAAVDGRNLIEGPDGTPDNPAVAFDIVDASGVRQHVIKFALFPDFESMHAKSGTAFPVSTEFHAPVSRPETDEASSLTFLYWPDGKWSYEATVKGGDVEKGDLRAGDKVQLSWADMTFEVMQVLDRAAVVSNVVESKDGKSGSLAVEIIVNDQGQEHREWLTEAQNIRFTTDKGDYRFGVAPNTIDVPFTLTLKDFKKIDYPGTMAASSYESDVTLEDAGKDLKVEQTIRMNEPLDYEGYRIFQSSFIENTGHGEASIFTVAKNPGIPWIYLGSCIIFLGAAYQFYWPKNGFKKKKEEDDQVGV